MLTTALFGSGVSFVSGIPGVKDITKRVLSGENIGRASDSNYYIGAGQHLYPTYTPNCLAIIDVIKRDIDSFYTYLKHEHYTNYEDIYYVLRQLTDSFNLEFENPAVNGLISNLSEVNQSKSLDLSYVVNETKKYLECVVWQMISKKIDFVDQYAILPELIQKLGLRNIVSLNHDVVLDNYLSQNHIEFNDGFAHKDFKFEQWQGFVPNDERLRYLKLHGSIDWFEVGIKEPHNHNKILKLPRGTDIARVHYHDERFYGVTDGTPKLLIGTFNKMLGYLSDLFEVLYDDFKSRLTETNVLIISGYGFSDKGINSKLSLWLNNDSSQKMVIIHPYMEDLLKNARGNFHLNIYNGREKHPKVHFIKKKFEDIVLDEIYEVI